MNEAVSALRRTLTLSLEPSAVARFGRTHLAVALALVWIAGMGRHWDDERAGPWMRSGVFSIGYALALAMLLHLSSLALRPRFPSYFRTLVCVGFTAPPALLYALPVERWMEPEFAIDCNLGFLFVVACWRVLAWIAWLHRVQGLPIRMALTSAALPLAGIVSALALLNLHHVTIDTMSGIQRPRSPEHDSYEAVVVLSVIAVLSSPIWLSIYVLDVVRCQKAARASRIALHAAALKLHFAVTRTDAEKESIVRRLESCGARRMGPPREHTLALELPSELPRAELRFQVEALLRDGTVTRLSSVETPISSL